MGFCRPYDRQHRVSDESPKDPGKRKDKRGKRRESPKYAPFLDYIFHHLSTLIAGGGNLRQDFIFARLEVDLAADGTILPVMHGADAADMLSAADFLQQEMQSKLVLTLESNEVASIELRQHNDDGASFLDLDDELFIQVARYPSDVDARPLLHDGPLLVK